MGGLQEKARRYALVHFDDEYSATESGAVASAKPQAEAACEAYTQGILKHVQERQGDAGDCRVILFPSSDRQSQTLAEILSAAVARVGLPVETAQPIVGGGTVRVLLHPGAMAASAAIHPQYVERVDFSTLPPGVLQMREVLHLPGAGCQLFKLEASELIPQDLNALFSMNGGLVVSRPVVAAAAAELLPFGPGGDGGGPPHGGGRPSDGHGGEGAAPSAPSVRIDQPMHMVVKALLMFVHRPI
jgi:hypothetical protein